VALLAIRIHETRDAGPGVEIAQRRRIARAIGVRGALHAHSGCRCADGPIAPGAIGRARARRGAGVRFGNAHFANFAICRRHALHAPAVVVVAEEQVVTRGVAPTRHARVKSRVAEVCRAVRVDEAFHTRPRPYVAVRLSPSAVIVAHARASAVVERVRATVPATAAGVRSGGATRTRARRPAQKRYFIG